MIETNKNEVLKKLSNDTGIYIRVLSKRLFQIVTEQKKTLSNCQPILIDECISFYSKIENENLLRFLSEQERIKTINNVFEQYIKDNSTPISTLLINSEINWTYSSLQKEENITMISTETGLSPEILVLKLIDILKTNANFSLEMALVELIGKVEEFGKKYTDTNFEQLNYISNKNHFIKDELFNRFCKGEDIVAFTEEFYFECIDKDYNNENHSEIEKDYDEIQIEADWWTFKIYNAAFLKKGKCHRLKGPALEYYQYQTYTQKWYKNGKLYRQNGPAIIEYDIKNKEWKLVYVDEEGNLIKEEKFEEDGNNYFYEESLLRKNLLFLKPKNLIFKKAKWKELRPVMASSIFSIFITGGILLGFLTLFIELIFDITF